MAFKKDPNAILDYTVDWTAYLTPIADTIATTTWIVPATLTKVSDTHTTMTATAFISGGTVDTTETVVCRITTAGGRTDDRSFVLKIVER